MAWSKVQPWQERKTIHKHQQRRYPRRPDQKRQAKPSDANASGNRPGLVPKREHPAPKHEPFRPKHVRAGWDEYFMNIAGEVATRSTCDRKYVGAVIVRDRTILSTGYNGSIRKLPHCTDVGHMLEGRHCIATIHAEANAIIQAAKNGVRIEDASLYTTSSPCWNCFKLIANSGIKRIYYGEFYRDQRIFDIAKKLQMELVRIQPRKTC